MFSTTGGIIPAKREDIECLRDVWSHLTLLATGINPPMSNTEAGELIAQYFYRLTGENISEYKWG